MDLVIDHAARTHLAEQLRHLVAGRITNDEFEDAREWSEDPAVGEVQHAAWFLYDDLREYRLAGRHRLGPAARREVARWILFLKSDGRYLWPPLTAWSCLFWATANVLTLGIASRVYLRRMRALGDHDAWPFFSSADLEAARRTTPYLCGPSNEAFT